MSDYGRNSSHNSTDSSRRKNSTDKFSKNHPSEESGRSGAHSFQSTGSSRRVPARSATPSKDFDTTGSHRRTNSSTGANRRVPDDTSSRPYRTNTLNQLDRNTYARDRYAKSGGRVEPTRGVLNRYNNQRSNSEQRPPKKENQLLITLISFLKTIIGVIGNFIETVAKRSKIALAALIILVLVILGGTIDSLTSIGEVHSRVVVGTVKAHGMTEAELTQALKDEYSSMLDISDVTIYRSEEAMKEQAQNPIDSGNLSPEEQAAQTNYWKANKKNLQAYVDYEGLAHEAFMAGRESIFDRIAVLFLGRKIDVNVEFNETELENFATTIDLALGYPYTNSEIIVENGNATASDSKSGMMVNREELKATLSEKFLNPDVAQRQFYEIAVETQPKISTEKGQAAATKVNAAIANGANFTYNQTSWSVDSTELGSWVNTQIVTNEETGESDLQPYFDPHKATGDISEHAKAVFPDGNENVSFEKKDTGEVVVKLGSGGTMPQIRSSVSALNDALFGENADTNSAPSIVVESTEVPSEMSFSEALNCCVITVISEFTTTYTADAPERNHNIQLAADRFDNSIVKANGGQWSFHEVVGESDRAHGFQMAGSIVSGEIIDEDGGGICQAATTMFNAVYESGLPVVRRTNHSMYISSYPEGRDAAVSYPDLDLIWENDTESDVLVKSSHTDTSVTVYLYGVSPGYTVETETGDWEDGTDFKKVVTYDENVAPGVSYIKTAGAKGHSITVVRTVKDKKGETVRSDTFVSVYDPTNEITVRGGTPEDWPKT